MSSEEGKRKLSGREIGRAGRERCRLLFLLLETGGTSRGVRDGDDIDDGADFMETNP
jgi:hypothetical protein